MENATNTPRRKIIYVDDVNYSLLSVKTRLQPYYEVFPAQSVETLYKILDKVIPDLILLDINMPLIDGFEITKQLKNDTRYSYIPIIYLTGKNDRKTILSAMEFGAVDLVTKPFTDEELVGRIENQFSSQGKQEEFKPVILAVDDNPSILRAINELLHRHYRVYTLPKPETLEMILEKIKPDLFLLDCKMPLVSGFDLVLKIREFPKYKMTPIIFLTSEGTIDTLNAAVNLGASDFIVKPIDEAVLRQKLALHTADYMMRRHLRAF